MASRRPNAAANARQRPPSTLSAPSGSRPRSALGKSSASQQSDAPTVDDAPPPHVRSQIGSEPEHNIQVVVRCRRRSDREILEGSPIVVSSAGARSTEITVQTEPPTSSFGLVQLPPTRTYPFDTVFGPEADQSMVYQEVVAPMLEEVVGGYNCTIFAYGQTGTGKTHTMQGDLKPTALGLPSPAAGMIPRVLNKLFVQLNEKFHDYSVRVSYIELYNEELRDLLADDFQAPSVAAQPMGKGAHKEQQPTLQIYDDSSKKGVTIQGLKEVTVKDAADAVTLLLKGSERKQIASTKFNDHSSRSHTIFTLTVHTKEHGAIGDDLLKVGKLNLVDLAGAENIGRSGAKEQRAAEAGNINKSLLTLGRVITLLVEKSQHIPYRESKLTRLLQDSLGGKTKTCIIATVSPARCNIEETISTLDYAIRAKSIKNRPEINQRTTKNMLLKEYVAEMDRLKSDLLAAREKHGMFFAQETWDEMQAEQQAVLSDLADTKSQLAEVESQLRGANSELEASLALIAKREQELASTRESLRTTKLDLEANERRLDQTRNALEEEIIVRQAHQDTESRLDGVATGLKSAVQHGIRDIEGLFGKLDRKTVVFDSNAKLAIKSGSSLGERAHAMQSLLEEFIKTHGQTMDGLAVSAEQFRTKDIEALSGLASLVKEQLGVLKDAHKSLQATENTSSTATSGLQKTIHESSQAVIQAFDAWSAGMLKTNLSLLQEIKVAGKASCNVAEGALDGLSQLIEALASDAQKQAAHEARVAADVKAMTEAAAAEEIRRLKQQNALLLQMLEKEQVEAERSRNDLVRRVSTMLEDYTRQRDTSLRKAFSAMQDGTAVGEKQWARLASEQGSKLDAAVQNSQEAVANVQRRRQEGKRKREDATHAISSIAASFEQGLSSAHEATSSAVANHRADVQEQLNRAQAQYDDAFEQLDRTKRARLDTTAATFTAVQHTYKTTREVATTSAKRVSEEVNNVLNSTNTAQKEALTYQSSMSASVATVQQIGSTLESDTNRDEHTGSTPRKRSYSYVQTWELTADRDTLLQPRRQASGKNSSCSNATLVPESVTDEADDEIMLDNGSDDAVPPPLSKLYTTSLDNSAAPRPVTDASENHFIAPVKPLQAAKGSTLPPAVPLAERPANIAVTRGSRRR
ncbi:kinesin 2 [Exidia glandulosa HHB12029]|uniref:Kinesin 2 n=1 Tax=Exidia glandulosa HHB12029 TaxID=1314781 RepID=A0A165DFH2_EXIGL|nr:kinesin 2 [Exidia glandulosa HHB12029]